MEVGQQQQAARRADRDCERPLAREGLGSASEQPDHRSRDRRADHGAEREDRDRPDRTSYLTRPTHAGTDDSYHRGPSGAAELRKSRQESDRKCGTQHHGCFGPPIGTPSCVVKSRLFVTITRAPQEQPAHPLPE